MYDSSDDDWLADSSDDSPWSSCSYGHEEKTSPPLGDEKSEEAKWVPFKPRKDSSPEKIPPTEDVSKNENESHEEELETVDIVILNWHEPNEVSKAATPTKDDIDLTYSLKHDEKSPVPSDQQKELNPNIIKMAQRLSRKIRGRRKPATSTDFSAETTKHLEVESLKGKFRDMLDDDESKVSGISSFKLCAVLLHGKLFRSI